jgi:SAM-dependent methyltransferase
MKNACIPDNINIFTTNSPDAANNIEEELTIKNCYWAPNEDIIKIVENICLRNKYMKNLEIGPGIVPFSLATDFIGCNEKITNYIEIDIDKQAFPFQINTFDFVYCRHVLEDIQNPDFLLEQIFKVSKYGGYLETPSPLIEVTKNIDAPIFSEKYCGYIHHRYIVWSNIQKNELYFLPKYSCILDHIIDIPYESKSHLYNLINHYPVYWNNYFLFDGVKKPNVIMYKNGVNFNTKGLTMIPDYIELVNKAINESIENTNYFITKYT